MIFFSIGFANDIVTKGFLSRWKPEHPQQEQVQKGEHISSWHAWLLFEMLYCVDAIFLFSFSSSQVTEERTKI